MYKHRSFIASSPPPPKAKRRRQRQKFQLAKAKECSHLHFPPPLLGDEVAQVSAKLTLEEAASLAYTYRMPLGRLSSHFSISPVAAAAAALFLSRDYSSLPFPPSQKAKKGSFD